MANKNENIQLKLQTLPNKPGIYQYFDENGTILYVGKAKNLKKRVSSYFNKNLQDGKTRILVNKIKDIKYLVVETELDALLLENNLIKEYQPKYNILLKDDKTYPWICVKNEAFPRVFSTRNPIKDGSKYYGPYPSVKMMNALLELIHRIYTIRTCSLDLSPKALHKNNYKVCLEYHIGNCKGPCELRQTEENYNKDIEAVHHILKGNISQVIQRIEKAMWEAADRLKFEKAKALKDKIYLLENYKSKSTVVSPNVHEVDTITFLEDDDCAFVNYLVIRSGAIIHAYTGELKKKLNESFDELIDYVLPQLRERYQSTSKEVVVEQIPATQWKEFSFFVPKRGDKKELIELSKRNTKFYKLEKFKAQKIKDPEAHQKRILEQIQKDFRLSELPVHIECFDNSNIQGTNPVAACVVFKNAKPSKKDYRHFNIKTVEGPNDFASMEEIVFRRYQRLVEEDQSLPQLVIIDGGKGQLGAALKSIDALQLRGKMAVVGIAKKLEEIYFPGDSLPLYIDKRSESLKVVQFLRNEAHRFGITHHRNKRSKNAIHSELTDIKGIGVATFNRLMKHFKTVKRLKDASINEIEKIVGTSKAQLILKVLHK